MATKKTKAPAKKYPEITFGVSQMNYCCGVAEIGGFREEVGVYNWRTNRNTPTVKKYDTKEEQAEACYKAFLQKTKDFAGWDGGYYTQLLVTLVSSYGPENMVPEGSHQFQELEDILLREGWTIYSVFINPNHGNEVTLYGKYFPERHMTVEELERAENGDDDEDY